MAPVDLDSFTQEELEKFIADYEEDSHKLALELFPSKPIAYILNTKYLYEFAKLKSASMINRLDGHIDLAIQDELKADRYYSKLEDYAKW